MGEDLLHIFTDFCFTKFEENCSSDCLL